MVFSATWFLLEQEGLLAQACLCNGLTALRRANLGELIAALREVIDSLCDSAWKASPAGRSGMPDVPDMKAFFQFAWADRQYVMRKRMWL